MLSLNDERRNYLTREEAARLMRGSVRWLEELQRRGDGPPCVKIGRKTLYPAAALHAWVERHVAPGDQV